MKRKLEKYRSIEEANYRTHDLPLNEIVVPVQKDFPNCRKYTKCCKDSQEFWNTLQERTKVIPYKNKAFRTTSVKLGLGKPPEGFGGW